MFNTFTLVLRRRFTLLTFNVEEVVRTRAYYVSLERPGNSARQNWEQARADLGISLGTVAHESRITALPLVSPDPVAVWLSTEQVLMRRGLEKFRVGIRRHKTEKKWMIADAGQMWFLGEFSQGLMVNVKFIHNAEPMMCVPGYESTGEAVGLLDTGSRRLPDALANLSFVVYDRNKRVFHELGHENTKVDYADYLLLQDDGSAVAGWEK